MVGAGLVKVDARSSQKRGRLVKGWWRVTIGYLFYFVLCVQEPNGFYVDRNPLEPSGTLPIAFQLLQKKPNGFSKTDSITLQLLGTKVQWFNTKSNDGSKSKSCYFGWFKSQWFFNEPMTQSPIVQNPESTVAPVEDVTALSGAEKVQSPRLVTLPSAPPTPARARGDPEMVGCARIS